MNTIKSISKLAITLVALLLMVSCKNGKDESETQDHPNVILILADDQGWGDVHRHGNELIETPTLDKLADEGAEFENFYVEPLCAPTRAGLLTGKYYLRTGASWVSRGLENIDPESVTLGDIFKENHYATGCFGKWHNGAHYLQHPNRQGFDEFVGFCAGHWENYFNTTLEENGKSVKAIGYITDYLTKRAIGFIKEHQNEPFFCYIPYNVPHSPFQVPDKYFRKYKQSGLDDRNACIYGMIDNMDENIDKILQTIDSLSLTQNTIVIFLSDNGPNGHRYNGVLKGIKGSIDEGGVKVPFLIRWPGVIPSGHVVRTLGAYVDILPTLIDLCHLKTAHPLNIDGMSLVPWITGDTKVTQARTLFSKKSTYTINRDGAVRTDSFRLVLRNRDTLLYDMISDPGQKTDLHATVPGLARRLVSAYNSYLSSVTGAYHSFSEITLGAKGDTIDDLPAHEASFRGHIRYMEGHGWAHDWLINWSDTADLIWWKIRCITAGKYQVYLRYTCPASDTGSVVRVYTQSSGSTGKISVDFDPPLIPSPDRVKRIEVYEKEWALADLGSITLTSQDTAIVVQAISIPGRQVGELKSLYLRRIAE